MKAMIFSAGRGTRLRPLTDNIPKALVEVGGKPLLQHVLEKLIASGTDDIVINVWHFADQIVSWIRDHGSLKADIRISDERGILEADSPLDTGGGIAHAAPLLLSDPWPRRGSPKATGLENILIHNVDIISNLNFSWFRKQSTPGDISTILVSSRNTSRYLLFDDEMRLVGWTNTATGEVRSPFKKLKLSGYRPLAFSGIHLISPSIFQTIKEMDRHPKDFPLYVNGRQVPPVKLGEKFPVMDLYLRAAGASCIRGAVYPGLKLMDVGKAETLVKADEFIRKLQH